jgi:hypothetical protein
VCQSIDSNTCAVEGSKKQELNWAAGKLIIGFVGFACAISTTCDHYREVNSCQSATQWQHHTPVYVGEQADWR